MTITTKTIINFLPFPSEDKLDLLEKYDSLPLDEQLRVSDMVWQLYHEFYQLKIQENFDKLIAEKKEKGENLNKNFYGEVLDKTRKEMQEVLTSAGESADLTAARSSMEKIIEEIKAAKIPIKQ